MNRSAYALNCGGSAMNYIGLGNEQIRNQLVAGLNSICREIGNPGAFENVGVDEEIAGTLTCRL